MPLVAWSPITQASRANARATFVEVKVQAPGVDASGTRDLAETTLVDAFLPFVFNCQSARAHAPARTARRAGTRGPVQSGGADRSRTDDIQLAKLALYQLSYSPIEAWSRKVVGLGGFEPPTSRLSGVRSKPTEL